MHILLSDVGGGRGHPRSIGVPRPSDGGGDSFTDAYHSKLGCDTLYSVGGQYAIECSHGRLLKFRYIICP